MNEIYKHSKKKLRAFSFIKIEKVLHGYIDRYSKEFSFRYIEKKSTKLIYDERISFKLKECLVCRFGRYNEN